MKRFLLAAAFSLLALPALAVPVSFTVGGTTYTPAPISAAEAARALAWATDAYPTIPNPAFDPACVVPPAVSCPAATLPNPNPVLSALQATWKGMIANVLSYEKAKSVKAVPDPTPIAP